MLKSSLGIFFYFILQNRHVWKLLSDEEKAQIIDVNYNYNNFRPDYKPELYQDGKNWESNLKSSEDYRNWEEKINEYLKISKPLEVCEIGPGTGYYSRLIIKNNNISSFTGIEINSFFKNYLKNNISQIKRNKFKFEILEKFEDIEKNKKFDLIYSLSAIHHIPDREHLFKNINNHLKQEGHFFAIEPTHYIPRIFQLLKKYFNNYRKKEYWSKIENLSTHHFCTLNEFKKFSFQDLDIIDYDQTKIHFKVRGLLAKIRPVFLKKFLQLYFSQEFSILLKKKRKTTN